jgi:hypothetical protein
MKIFKTKEQREKERAEKQLARDKATTRKPELVAADYGRLAADAGDKQYQVDVFKAELREINKQLHVLSHEYKNSIRVHGEPKAEEPKPAPVAVKPTDEQKQAAIAMLNSPQEAPSEAQPVQ